MWILHCESLRWKMHGFRSLKLHCTTTNLNDLHHMIHTFHTQNLLYDKYSHDSPFRMEAWYIPASCKHGTFVRESPVVRMMCVAMLSVASGKSRNYLNHLLGVISLYVNRPTMESLISRMKPLSLYRIKERNSKMPITSSILGLSTRNKKHFTLCDTGVNHTQLFVSFNDIFTKIQCQGHSSKCTRSGEFLNVRCYKKVVNVKVIGHDVSYASVFICSRLDQY